MLKESEDEKRLKKERQNMGQFVELFIFVNKLGKMISTYLQIYVQLLNQDLMHTYQILQDMANYQFRNRTANTVHLNLKKKGIRCDISSSQLKRLS
jgi:hypothetical protein